MDKWKTVVILMLLLTRQRQDRVGRGAAWMRAECASPWWEQLAVEPASVSFLAVIYRDSVRVA